MLVLPAPVCLAADTPRSMASARSFAFCPGSLTVRQRQRRDHSQHAAEQPPTQMYRLDTGSGDVLSDFAAESEPKWHLLIADDSLFVFLGDEILTSLDHSLKKVRWPAEASKEWTSARPYLWHGTVLAGNRRELVAFRSSDGTREWSHQFPETVRGVGTSDEVLYVGTLKGPVFAYSPGP